MTDEVIAIKLTEHDKHLDTLSDAVSALASTNSKTNDKLDSIVEIMGKQNVLIEKMSSLGKSLDTLRDMTRTTEHVVNKYPDVDSMKSSIKVTEGLPTTTTIRWAVGILFFYLAASGNYIIGHIHELESKLATHETVDGMVTVDATTRLMKLEDRYAK